MIRRRFVHSKRSLAANAPWGVYDELARCWAVAAKLSKPNAEAAAARLEAAKRGGGFS